MRCRGALPPHTHTPTHTHTNTHTQTDCSYFSMGLYSYLMFGVCLPKQHATLLAECVCEKEREYICVCVREREIVCVCVCVCERER